MHQHDHERLDRIGMPEAVLCGTKTVEQVREIAIELAATGQPRLLTRLNPSQLASMPGEVVSRLDVDTMSATGFLNGTLPERAGRVTIVAAGTSDLNVAAEASRTLTFSGVANDLIADVGVAGLWRLQARLDEIAEADVVIAVAGMDAALVSVLGGLIAQPIVAVPTSVGYGVASGGSTALNSALASCAQGVAVVNIDNGFGAACAVVRMLSLLGPDR